MKSESIQHSRQQVLRSQLSGADSFFLDVESDECPMNMGLLMIFGEGSDEALEQSVRDVVAQDTPLTRSLKKKIRQSAWGFDHPHWVEDARFNVDNHIHRHELKQAADSPAFNQLVADIVQQRIPLSRPPWEVHIISGLDNGQSAMIGKLHHALADGATGLLLIQQLMGVYHPRKGRDTQSANAETAEAAVDSAERASHRLSLPRRLFYSLLSGITLRLFFLNRFLFKQRLKEISRAAPHTRFNTLLSDRRSYAHGQMALTDLRRIHTAFKCSRNDVFLALISGALRRYLQEHDELPQQSLYTGLPLVLMGDEKRAGAANQLTFYRSSLATNVADPVARLNTISQRLARATQRARRNWSQRLLERLAMLPPRAIRSIITLYIKLLSRGLFRPNVNVVSTLLPGPAKSSVVAGREVVGIHPVSIPYHGAGLFISAIRYQDTLQFGIIAGREQVPDPEHLADLMQDALKELLDLADKHRK